MKAGTGTVSQQHYRQVRAAIERLAGTEEPLALQTLADEAGLSPFHFQRTFLGLAGVTLADAPP